MLDTQLRMGTDVSLISSEAINLLTFLLPGFIAGALFFLLTSHPKPSAFERTVQALIFTMTVQIVIGPFGFLDPEKFPAPWNFPPWPQIFPMLVAIILGTLWALCINHDLFHRFFRELGITRENSHPSEWYSAFSRIRSLVVLNFEDGRRLVGWPEEWPSDPASGHFLVIRGAWVDKDNKLVLIERADALLVPVSDVRMVEFVGYDGINVE